MVCQRMELKLSLSEVRRSRSHTHRAAHFPLSLCLMCPDLAKPPPGGFFPDHAMEAGPTCARERIGGLGVRGISPVCRHNVSLSLAQLAATIFRKEGLTAWPQLMQLLQHSTHSPHIPEREVLSHGWRKGGTKRLDRPCKVFPLIPYS